jgi:hypothetical protein
MKKLLVLFVSAALVLSLAVVSLAAVTFNGDFRYNMYDNETTQSSTLVTTDTAGNVTDKRSDSTYGETDLRLKINGDLSETVKVFANLRIKNTNNASDWKTSIDEFWAKDTYGWGTVKMGYYEYNFTPNRVELNTAGLRVTPKNDATFEANIPLTECFVFDAVLLPYSTSSTDDGSYAVGLNYNAENWGLKAAYWDLKLNDSDYVCIDAYYMFNENMKFFANAADYSLNDGKTSVAYYDNNKVIYDEGFDPVIGFAWDKIADTKLSASLEYALNSREDVGTGDDFNEYVFKAGYTLPNSIVLEFYHYVAGSDMNKDMFRVQYKF